MFHVRTTKTASGAVAVQVVRYRDRKTVVVSHIGSTHDAGEIDSLKQAGLQWIERESKQLPLFSPRRDENSKVLILDKARYLGFRYTFFLEVIGNIFQSFQFSQLRNPLLLDLIMMRIIEPVSKLESLELLDEMFGIHYGKSSLYQAITTLPVLKEKAEEKVVQFAKKHFSFDFSIVFYDVTTLYFESFKEDVDKNGQTGLRKNGFSKDNKANQPQIVIGLIVSREGFPVCYDIFAGNTFEGKTFIPAITKFRNTHKVKTLTVVADAAMISFDNVEALLKNNLSYIVGARMASLKPEQIKEISTELTSQTQALKELATKDGFSMRIETERGLLVCDFSFKRYQKDKWEMEKQIVKAERLLLDNKGVKKTKFLKNKDDTRPEQIINTELIEKTKLLLGIKGYYTNLAHEEDKTIIDHYHSLWQVEKTFRIAKSDLSMRPIYHFKEQTIKAHILICFMALAVTKYMELKTGKSTRKIVKLLKSITDARILNTLTGEEIIMRKEMNEEEKQLWKTLIVPY